MKPSSSKATTRREAMLAQVKEVERLVERLGGSIRVERLTGSFEEAKLVTGYVRDVLKEIEGYWEPKHDRRVADPEERSP